MERAQLLRLYAEVGQASYEHHRLDKEVSGWVETTLPATVYVNRGASTGFGMQQVTPESVTSVMSIGQFPEDVEEMNIKMLGRESGKEIALKEAKVLIAGLNCDPTVQQQTRGKTLIDEILKASLTVSGFYHDGDTVLLNPMSAIDLEGRPQFVSEWQLPDGSPAKTVHFTGKLLGDINVFHYPVVPENEIFFFGKDNIRTYKTQMQVNWGAGNPPSSIEASSRIVSVPIHPKAVIKIIPV